MSKTCTHTTAALVVCLDSAPIAVWMVSSLPDTDSNGESELAMVVDENLSKP